LRGTRSLCFSASSTRRCADLESPSSSEDVAESALASLAPRHAGGAPSLAPLDALPLDALPLEALPMDAIPTHERRHRPRYQLLIRGAHPCGVATTGVPPVFDISEFDGFLGFASSHLARGGARGGSRRQTVGGRAQLLIPGAADPTEGQRLEPFSLRQLLVFLPT